MSIGLFFAQVQFWRPIWSSDPGEGANGGSVENFVRRSLRRRLHVVGRLHGPGQESQALLCSEVGSPDPRGLGKNQLLVSLFKACLVS